MGACVCVCVFIYLCVVIVGEPHASMLYVLYGGVLFIFLYLRMRSFERLKANSIVKPGATEGLREPEPSIRAGHIPRMQTNALEQSPPTGPTAQRSKNRVQGCWER